MKKKENQTKKGKILRIISGCLAIFIYVIIGNTYSAKAFEDPYNKDLQIKKASIYGYHIADIKNAFQIKKQAIYTNKEDMEKDYDILKQEYKTQYGTVTMNYKEQ